ncbi:MAG: FtsX-like permease family protein [Bacillota bacterium]|nr:FtsX-like permease family protein [Bacillota bacterium]
MSVYFKIALRNILKNKKRTALIGLTLTSSSVLLLFSFAMSNGIARQILEKYKDFQSGDVTVLWSNVKEIESSDPSRLFFSAYDARKDSENKAAIQHLNEFLKTNSKDIKTYFKSVRGNCTVDTGKYASFSMLFGLSQEEAKYLKDKKIIKIEEGDMPFGHKYGVCISDDMAEKNNIKVGDWITIDSTTFSGYVNTQEYQVVGLYRSSSDYDSIYVYMSESDAVELLDQPPEYFQSLRIYLKDPDTSVNFAEKLDKYLLEKNDVLRAEDSGYSAQFYTMIAGMLKILFTVFVVFIMFIIAVGIRSVVRMNLFERLKEFGTLRAIGASRLQSFLIIFLEIFLMSLIFFAAAYVLTIILVAVLSQIGIYIGKGTIAYVLGGESIYPLFVFTDTFTAIAIMTVFSLFSPLKPGLKLCFQKITDLLAQNQKPVSVPVALMKSLLGREKSIRIMEKGIGG